MTDEAHDGHSAAYFGASRDYWHNRDYVELVAQRLGLSRVRKLLDVGCGVGHWTEVVARGLPEDAEIHGVDRDAVWVARAAERLPRGAFRVAAAEALPYPDDTFDLVTCQTLLIHVPDPVAVLAEMVRVTRPGGQIFAVEPNNLANALVLDSTMAAAPIETILALVRFQLGCERGKIALGEGNNSLGDQLPALFARAGIQDVRVWLNDKASPITPPYETPEERALVDEARASDDDAFWIWSRADTERFWRAGGGDGDAFGALWSTAMSVQRAAQGAVADGTYATAGGALAYLVCGKKRG